jgi:hypothetical protein
MKELLEQIARAPVDNLNEVEVRQIDGEQVIVFELRTQPEDTGKVIRRRRTNREGDSHFVRSNRNETPQTLHS